MACNCISSRLTFVLNDTNLKLGKAKEFCKSSGGTVAASLTEVDFQTISQCMGTMQQGYRIGLISSIETGPCSIPESKKKYYWTSNKNKCTDGTPLNISDRLLQCSTDKCKRCHVASIYPGSSDNILSSVTWSRCSDKGSFICQYENDRAPLNSKKNCSLERFAYSQAQISSPIVGALVAVILVILLLTFFLLIRRTRKYELLKVRLKRRSSLLWSNTFTKRHETIWS